MLTPEGTSKEPPNPRGPCGHWAGPTAESEAAHCGGELTKCVQGMQSHPPLTATKGPARNLGGASSQGKRQPPACPSRPCVTGSAPALPPGPQLSLPPGTCGTI